MENDRELVLTRIIPAPREKLYRAWTEPELLKQWFAPAPWTTTQARTQRTMIEIVTTAVRAVLFSS